MTEQIGNETTLVYIGSYTGAPDEGITICRFDPSSGVLDRIGVAKGITNPSYLAIHPYWSYLYAVNELEGSEGTVSAFAVTPATGGLTFLNRQSSGGVAPCHLSLDHNGQFLLVANYGSGSLSVLPVDIDGRLGEATGFVQHEGSGVHPERQEGPHAHFVAADPANQYVLACDLGLDRVMIYRLDHDQGELSAGTEPWAEIPAGAGPRHLAFHPQGHFAYVVNELDSSIAAFRYDGIQGTLQLIEKPSTLPPAFDEANYPAAIHVHPSGRFLYASNRGHDSIAIYAIDEHNGRLVLAGHQPTGGDWPRDFAIDPSGRYLLAANQKSDSVVSFRIDAETGRLAPTGSSIEVASPVCVLFYKVG